MNERVIYKPLLWTTWDISGGLVPVYLSDESITEELRGCIGVTTMEYGRLEVYIAAHCPRNIQDETVVHEFVHATLWGKKSLKLHHKKEEQLACEIAASGWRNFCMPKRPPGTRALERYAQKRENERH